MTHHEGTGTGSIETLKRLKEAETAADAGLARLRAEATARLATEKERVEAYVVAARSAAEAAREAALTKARADAEAAQIVADGRPAADAEKSGGWDAARKAKVLAAVLGEFSNGKGGSG